jgi:hypothetical protein
MRQRTLAWLRRRRALKIGLVWLVLALLVLPFAARAGARVADPASALHSPGSGPEIRSARMADAGTATITITPAGTSAATPTETAIVLPEGTLTVTPVGTSTATPLPETVTPSPAREVSVVTVKIEKGSAGPDWHLSHRSMKSATQGSTLALSIYYTVTGIGKTDRVTDQWTITRKKRIIFRRRHVHPLGSPTSGLYRDFTRFKLGSPGSYWYVGRVTIDRITDAGRTTIRAVRKRR